MFVCAVHKQLNGIEGCYELFQWVSAGETIGGSYHFQEGGLDSLAVTNPATVGGAGSPSSEIARAKPLRAIDF